MKVLAFTDNHTLNQDILSKKAKDVDIILSMGDMSLMGHYLEEQLEWMNTLGKKVLVIPGNHESYTDFEKICTKFENVINLDKKAIVIDGVLFMGFGNEGFAKREPEFEALVPMFKEAMKRAPKSVLTD